MGNFGDALTTLLLEKFFSKECLFENGHLHLIGSVITKNRIGQAIKDGYSPGDGQGRAVFWGCGKKDSVELDPDLQRRCIFLGVRGPMSRDVLGLPRSTPLGDTALLIPRVYEPSHDLQTSGKVLWVPHVHSTDPTSEDLEGCPDYCIRRPAIPNTVAACMRFIDGIVSSRFVMANAMHAAIVALAYNVPFAFWSGSQIDNPFKWADFASGAGFKMGFSRTFREGETAYERAQPQTGFRTMDLRQLLNVAPFRLKPGLG